MKPLVIDGQNALLGRLASYVAKQALLGKNVVIVNCRSVVISGSPRSIIKQYQTKRARGGSSLNGPNFPRMPERIVKRTVRGMLPYQQGRGLDALKRVLCYNSVPAEYVEMKKLKAGKEKHIETIALETLHTEL